MVFLVEAVVPMVIRIVAMVSAVVGRRMNVSVAPVIGTSQLVAAVVTMSVATVSAVAAVSVTESVDASLLRLLLIDCGWLRLQGLRGGFRNCCPGANQTNGQDDEHTLHREKKFGF